MGTITLKPKLFTEYLLKQYKCRRNFASIFIFPKIILLSYLLTFTLPTVFAESPEGFNCTADAGTLSPDCSNGEFCEISGSVEVSASPDGNAVIPAGFSTLYLLSRGNSKLYVDDHSAPSFEVFQTGQYRIHSLVYNNDPQDPDYLDLSGFLIGQSNITDLENLIASSGVCADLDELGTFIRVRKCLIPFLIQAKDDFLNTFTDQSVSGNILINDHLEPGVPVDLTVIGGPFNGNLAIDGSGNMVYTPNPGFSGEDEFTYQICDNRFCPSRCILATVYIEVINSQPINNPPIANLDAVCIPAGDVIDIDVRSNDIDQDGDVLQDPSPYTNPNSGSLIYNADGTIKYTPNQGFSGYDLFSYIICDQGNPSLCDTGLVTIRVKFSLSSGNPPIPMDDAITMPRNTGRFGETVIENDYEPDGDPITYSLDIPPQHGTVTFSSNGDYDYVPDIDYVGPDHFVYTMTDKDGSAKANVIITVHGVGSIFPVEWLSLGARLSQGNANLEWSTAFESNSSHFEVERSLDDGFSFSKIGQLSAAGSSQEIQRYQYIDPQVVDLGINRIHYKLKQVDLDGAFTYSRTFTLEIGETPRISLSMVPNPATNEVQITWSATEAVYQLEIYNLLGEQISAWNLPDPARFGSFSYDISELPAGLYLIKSFSDNVRSIERLWVK